MDAGRVLATGTPAELMAAHRHARISRSASSPCLPEEKRMGHKELTIPPRAVRQGGDRHRSQRPDAPLRQLHRRRPRHAVDRARRDLRLPRLQRLRQVHHDEDADRPLAADRGHRDALRQLRRSRQHGGAQEPRLHDAGVLALRRAERPPEPGPCTRACITSRPRRRKRASTELVERFGLRHASRRAGRRPADGLAPAALAGRRRAARAADPDSRRAHVGRRSGRARQLLGAADRSLAQAGRDDLRHDALHERRHALRPHLAHERRQGAGLRRARRS